MSDFSRPSPVPIPRNYGLYEAGKDMPRFYTAAAGAIGEALRMDRREIRDAVESWAEYRFRIQQRAVDGEGFSPLFGLDEDYSHVPTLETREIISDYLLPGIIKTEGSRNLWAHGGDKAIREGYLGGRVVSGLVKTRSDGRRSDKMKYWSSVLRKGLDGDDAVCQCQDHMEGRRKGVKSVCVHLSSIMQEVGEERPSGLTWLPYRFSGRASLPSGLSRDEIEELSQMEHIDQEESPDLSALMVDVLFARYVMGRKLYGINNLLSEIPHDYHDSTVPRIKSSGIRFGAIREGWKALKDDKLRDALEHVEGGMFRRLVADGFARKHPGIYSVEFRGSENEAMANDWVRGDLTIRPCFTEGLPPFAVVRKEIPGANARPFSGERNTEHPFTRPGRGQVRQDDASRKDTFFQVEIPRKFPVPDILKDLYRAELDQNVDGSYAEKRKLMREHGIL